MTEWGGLRTLLTAAVWLTVAAGALMLAIWLRFGGGHAVGPEDELHSDAGAVVRTKDRAWTSIGSAQIGLHAFLGLLTASLITYATAFDDDRSDGYIAVVLAVLVTAVPGVAMFVKWRRGDTPRIRKHAAADVERAEDHLPRVVVYLHGLGALAVLAAGVALFFVDR